MNLIPWLRAQRDKRDLRRRLLAERRRRWLDSTEECRRCRGSGEVLELLDGSGTSLGPEGDVFPCVLCDGTGRVPK